MERYTVHFVIDGLEATLDEEFTRHSQALAAASKIDRQGYPTEIVNETKSL